MVGRTISHYRILSQLGAGGMGVVYRAEDVRLGREVAVKFVSEDFAHDEQALQRLRSEARAASALNHGNICTIFDVGEDDGHPFIVMELMKGQTLRDRLTTGPLKIHQLVDIGIEIADALQSTHSDGIIHRDIKPGNVFLTDRGHVKILDFGLAKLTPHFTGSSGSDETIDRTVTGVTLGTISYMSPEQATGDELDARTDLFSLGVVLYECATGRHPFPGKTSAVTLAAILNKTPLAPVAINPEVPLRLQEVINNCLEKDRELRYQSAADLRADLKRVRRDLESGRTGSVDRTTAYGSAARQAEAAGLGRTTAATTIVDAGQTAPTVMSTRATADTKSSRGRLIGGAVAIVAILALVALVLWRDTPPSPATQTAAPIEQTPAAPPVSQEAVQNRLALATASIDARNYRAAAAYAAEALALDAGNPAAAKIRDEAQAMLVRFDEALNEARSRLTSGDVQGASRALETARGIDPTSPSLIELSSRLADQFRAREAAIRESTRADARRDARSTPPQLLPPAPSKPPAATQPSTPAPAPPPAPIVPTPPVAPPVPPAAAPPSVVLPEPAPAPKPAPPPERREPDAAAAAAAAAAQDDAAIRRLMTTYARAIEGKDLALFRSIKPNLSREEERRLQEGFRAVTAQQVNVSVISIDRRGDEATVVLRRRDSITAGGRQQTVESQQTMRLNRANGSWVIVEIK